jgi:MFS family permease
MPDYISSLGGEDYKGYIIGLFTTAAALSRPISGKLADSIGRIPVMIVGGGVCVIMSFFYPLFTTVFAFLVLRFLHGLSTGFMPTGSTAYLADIVPSDRRGEAMGIMGIMSNLGFMIGNAVSSILTSAFGLTNLFYISGALALISVLILLRLPESLREKQKFTWSHLRIKKLDIWDNRAVNPAMVMMLTVMSFGTLLTLIPDYSKHLGIDNKGLFLSIMTISTVLTRLFTKRTSDKIGRAKTCMYGNMFWIISTILLSILTTETFYAAAITCGIATGLNSPAIFAWAVDVAKGVRAGRSLATLFVAMEVGIGVGAFGSAAVYRNVASNLTYVFVILTLINFLALVYTIRLSYKR